MLAKLALARSTQVLVLVALSRSLGSEHHGGPPTCWGARHDEEKRDDGGTS